MKVNIVKECTLLSLEEKITFPEVVMRLAEAGVERYIVDIVGKKKLSYGKLGETHLDALTFKDIAIPEQFDASAVKQAISDIQQGKIQYLTFLSLIMNAGCSHYEVFITGKKAIYFGRQGDQHIEEFPRN